MKYELEEIQQSALKIGLSKQIVQALTDNLPHKRSSQQNRSLHLLFNNISFELNRMGLQFTYRGIKGMEIEVPYTPETVKDYLWRPLQQALIGKESTTKLTTEDINKIFETLAQWFAENGIVIDFPSEETI